MPMWFYADGTPFSASFVDSKSGAKTWTGVNIGVADASRIIVVAVSSLSGTAVSAVDVGGVTATNRVDGNRAQLWTAKVPTGTTCTITLTVLSATLNAIGVYALYGLSLETPFASGTGTSSATANVAAGGFAIACAAGINGSSGPVWTGLTLDYTVTISSDIMSSASALFASAQTPLSVSETGLASPNMALGSWGPT
jgi:hypothetical protein